MNKDKFYVNHFDYGIEEYSSLEAAQNAILEDYVHNDEGIHPEIESVVIYKVVCEPVVIQIGEDLYKVEFKDV